MGHGGQNLDLLCILNHLFVVLIKVFFMRVVFYSLLLSIIFLAIVSMELV